MSTTLTFCTCTSPIIALSTVINDLHLSIQWIFLSILFNTWRIWLCFSPPSLLFFNTFSWLLGGNSPGLVLLSDLSPVSLPPTPDHQIGLGTLLLIFTLTTPLLLHLAHYIIEQNSLFLSRLSKISCKLQKRVYVLVVSDSLRPYGL